MLPVGTFNLEQVSNYKIGLNVEIKATAAL